MNSFAEMRAIFDVDIYSMLDEVFKMPAIQQTMIDFNQAQLQGGQDALGQKIVTIGGSPYRARTIKIKKRKGQPTSRVTLKDTGEFYDTFKVKFVQNGYEITADFDKGSSPSSFSEGDVSSNILDNFDEKFDFLGLQDEYLAELVLEHVYNMLYNILRKKLGL